MNAGSSRRSLAVNYKEDDSEDDDDDDDDASFSNYDDDDDEVIISLDNDSDKDDDDDSNHHCGSKNSMESSSRIRVMKNNKECIATKLNKRSLVVETKNNNNISKAMSRGKTEDLHGNTETREEDAMQHLVVTGSPRKRNVTKKEKLPATTEYKDIITNQEGIDIVIPHSLLDKSRGTGKNECMVLVQVANEPSSSLSSSVNNTASSTKKSTQHRPLDFYGQSGAIGRFEADGNGVILDLKGYQYRGTIRPGPTAMVVAMTRDGKLKVESITDEFVTLDAETRTDVMAKLDAVVERGRMDETYHRYDGDDDVNNNKKTKMRENYYSGDDQEDNVNNNYYHVDDDVDDNGDIRTKGTKKRARSASGSSSVANIVSSGKKRKTSTTNKKRK